TTTGTVSGGNGSPFTVSGTHTYTATGTDTVAVTLSDDPPGTATATADSTATVSGQQLVGHVTLSAATEGTALPGTTTVAIFTDTNTSDTAGNFTATIDWGDGTTTTGTVSGSNRAFAVAGGHTYADEGSDPLSVTIADTLNSATTSPSGTVTVAEGDTLAANPITFAASVGQPFTGTVASFTDPTYPNNVASDFTATIDWGDGSPTTTGTVSGGNGSPFTVSGTHTYTATGTDTVAVTLSDDPPGTATATADSTATVSGQQLVGHVTLSAATEGTALPGTTTVAIFTDTNTSDTAGNFTATIDWGDGTTTTGTVSGSNRAFAVAGGHTYADEGSDPLSVTIADTLNSATTSPSGTVTVAEGDTLAANPITFAASVGQPFTGTVASFTDPTYPNNVASDFTATIDWGDGSPTTTGTVSGGNGSPFTVSGTHTYTATGTDTVAVTLSDDPPGTATATADSTATVSGQQLVGHVTLSAATEGTALPGTTTVAIFTDTNTSDTAGNFTATIDWGDGTTTTGTVSGSNRAFAVAGGHTYADEGSDPLSVTIADTLNSATTSPSGTVTVAEGDTLAANPITFAASVGQPFTGTVASFTDPTYPNNVASDFTATIDWGDGSPTTTGTVSGGSGSPFTVSGTHTYTATGTDTVAVTLSDDPPGTATATADSTATVSGQPTPTLYNFAFVYSDGNDYYYGTVIA